MIAGLTLPHKYMKSNQERLVICLHGYGSSMDDLFSLAHDLSSIGHVVSLNAPYSTPWGGSAWFDLDYSQDGSVRVSNTNQIDESVVLLQKEIFSIQKTLGIAAKNTILLGFSQGAMMALECAFRSKESLLAAVVLSGRGVNAEVPLVDSTAIIQTHGVQDQVIPIGDARKLNVLLTKTMKNYVYQEYEDMGHGISPECWQFVLSQLKSLTTNKVL
jgi:phospholipase/carboxylesterase